MSLLEFDRVSYQYPSEDFDIIDQLSFSVEPGAFHCIVGVSGCGKSTVFRLINGLLQPKAGKILVGGVPITEQKHYWRCRWKSSADRPKPSAGSWWMQRWRMWVWPGAGTKCPGSCPAACVSGRPLPAPC